MEEEGLMSVESINIFCTDCEFTGWSGVSDGIFMYELPDGNIPIRRRLAWCHACKKIIPSEELPTDDLLRQAKIELEILRKQIDLEGSLINQSRSFLSALLSKPRSEALDALKLREIAVKSDLDEIMKSRKFIDFSRKPRCLACGSQEIIYLPRFPTEMQSALNAPAAPVLLVMKHPNCGGEFKAVFNGISFNRRFSERLYSVDGIRKQP